MIRLPHNHRSTNGLSLVLSATIFTAMLVVNTAYSQYECGDTVNFNAVHPNCFVSLWPNRYPGCQGITLVGEVSWVRENMSGPPTFLHYQQRMVVREEVADENFGCSAFSEISYDSAITLSAEYWQALNIPTTDATLARYLAGLAGENFLVTRLDDEGLTEIAPTTPYPFEMRGFVRDRPVLTGLIELPSCSEIVYISSLPTGSYRISRPDYDTTVTVATPCDVNNNGILDPNETVNGTLRCGTVLRTGVADIINLEPTFIHRVRSLGGCGCGAGDIDGDGIPDDDDPDMDGDGIGNNHDNDTDGDGIPNDVDEDDDHDGIPDDQDDNPTGPDESDDIDGDGIPNDDDDDIDGDGITNDDDDDMDGDGVENEDDLDDDADGITDLAEFFRRLFDLINDLRDFIHQLV